MGKALGGVSSQDVRVFIDESSGIIDLFMYNEEQILIKQYAC